MKNPIPEYTARLLPNSQVSFQYKLDEYRGGGVYKRKYEHVFACLSDLTDKFGARFASSVIKDLGNYQFSTNRSKGDREDALDMQNEILNSKSFGKPIPAHRFSRG